MGAKVKDRLKLKEIAELAGVSPATVTLVRAGKNGVSDDKRAQISFLLAQNGYSQSAVSSHQVTFLFLKYIKHSLLVDGNPGFVTSIMDSIEEECRKNKSNLLVSTITRDSLRLTVEQLEFNPPDGIFLLGTEIEQAELEYFLNMPCPVVVVDNPVDNLPMSSITMDNRSAIYSVVKYLHGCGHTGIGFLQNELPASNCICRERAFADAVLQFGYKKSDCPIFSVQPTTSAAYASIKKLISKNVHFPSALIANNDAIALGALKAFNEDGIRVPEDVSLVGFDGLPFSEVSSPPLTTIAVPCREIGSLAVQMMYRLLEHPEFAPSKMRVTTKIIYRSSVKEITPSV